VGLAARENLEFQLKAVVGFGNFGETIDVINDGT
jgi:hypothetical protein